MSTLRVDTITDEAGTGPVSFPNGVTGVATTPASTVIYVAQITAPTGYLKANGAAISRTTYADLFAAIGTTFGTGDGSTTFNVPDLRGEFIRSWDDSRFVDINRSFGSFQGEAFKMHRHVSPVILSDLHTNSANSGMILSSRETTTSGNEGDEYNRYTQYDGGPETRPRNIALLACIKY